MNEPAAHILITRPTGQETQLAHGCRQLGLTVSHIPCLAIQALADAPLQSRLEEDADIVLFTSQNAVLQAHSRIALPWPGFRVHAIGQATAQTLATIGQSVELMPVSPYNSESYLAQIEAMPAQRLLIIKGEGGRTHIAKHLHLRNWTVSSVDVYRRVLPTVSRQHVADVFTHPLPDVVSVGSNETLLNLMKLVEPYREVLLNIPLLVNSVRCRELAATLGFAHEPMVAVPAGDSGQLRKLQAWLKTGQRSDL